MAISTATVSLAIIRFDNAIKSGRHAEDVRSTVQRSNLGWKRGPTDTAATLTQPTTCKWSFTSRSNLIYRAPREAFGAERRPHFRRRNIARRQEEAFWRRGASESTCADSAARYTAYLQAVCLTPHCFRTERGSSIRCGKTRFSFYNRLRICSIKVWVERNIELDAGAQPRLKSWGEPRFGSQHRGACAPSPANGWAGCWVGEGVALPLWGSGGITPGKFFENSDAKSCILVTTCCDFFANWKIWSRSWGTNTLLVPQPKSWGPVSPGPYGCCAYGWTKKIHKTPMIADENNTIPLGWMAIIEKKLFFYRVALNVARFSNYEKAVCLSVRPSVCKTRALWQNGRKICPDFFYIIPKIT